jgi:hypothetical protein
LGVKGRFAVRFGRPLDSNNRGNGGGMKRLIALVTLTSICAPSISVACDHVGWTTTLHDGTRMKLDILEADISPTAPWKPELEEPPLTVTSAYFVAMNWARTHYERYDDVSIGRVSLARFGCPGETPTDHWYYVFDLALVLDGSEVRERHWVGVLMDRRVVTPVPF